MNLLATFLLPALLAAPGPSGSSGVEAQLRQLIRQRLDAYAERDAARWARLVADDCVCGPASKAELFKAIEARPASVKNWYGEIADLQVRTHGTVAVARYRVTEFTQVGEHRTEARQWRTEAYLQKSGGWILIGLADVPIPADPPVAHVDPKVYDAYVGRYQYAPDAIDTITREGDRLFAQASGGQPREEIFPEDEVTYFVKGQDGRLIFVKDPQGRVTSIVFRQNGQDLVGTRLP